MNIWYISKYASPSKYFFGTRHFYLAEEWVKSGNRVCVISSNSSHLTRDLPVFKGKFFREEINGVETIWLNTFKSRKSSGISRIVSWLHFDWQLLTVTKKNLPKPDAVIVSSLALTTVIPGLLLARKYKAKFIFEVRDIWPLSIIVLGGYSKNNPFVRVLSWVEKLGYNKADLVVGTIPNLQGHVANVTDRPVNCICIPQGLSTSFYENEQANITSEYHKEWIPENSFLVCYAGTLNANNPLDTLLEAARLLKSYTSIKFLILGKGDKKEDLMEKSANLGNVLFPPPLPKNQVNSFLRHVHVCYDSFESELANYGLSRNKWIDYMYAAKPIICSYDGFQSMINEAGCGDFIQYGNADKLAEAILAYSRMNTTDLAEMGQRGKTFLLNQRTFDKLAGTYLDYIQSS